jgi:hypothetical protein
MREGDPMSDQETRTDVSAEHVVLTNAGAGTVEADRVEMEQAGAALIIAGESVSMHESGAAAVVSDGEAKMLQSGSGVVLSESADVNQSFVGILAAREVTLGPESKVLATWVEAAVFGAVFGIVAALVDITFRGFAGRR